MKTVEQVAAACGRPLGSNSQSITKLGGLKPASSGNAILARTGTEAAMWEKVRVVSSTARDVRQWVVLAIRPWQPSALGSFDRVLALSTMRDVMIK
jgi:hypothetical protein